ncbi:hypothetical protein ASG87_13345 [Frateuria sp. Soil773]|uniref:hypothetical protein n=1 Tax=Frateuria sp. Soil773 TaxID=1736407 RepID=UPI0006F4D645|nr:hypothetical protein [Frateuria sp. Soil773]KRE99968.1 hypothetical protein ASG87_13345 [Frateuria sp. Soil773]
MNEFEWRRQLRDLHAPVAPRRDLWPQIEAALDAEPAPAAAPIARRPASNRSPWLLAAGFAGLTLLALGLSLQQTRHAPSAPVANTAPAGVPPWKPEDPRLAGAAIELDAARMELQQALQQAPHSGALQRLLNRNEQQQSYLRRLDQAG